MAGKSSKIPMINRDLVRNSDEPEEIYELTFEFIDEGIFEFQSCENSLESNISYSSGEILMDQEEDENDANNSEENKVFWALQEELLKATLCRTTSFESKVRKATKEALKELKFTSINCSCRKMISDSCRKCMQREISERLTNEGYNCFVCKSKWKSSPEIVSGEYTYMEVVQNASSKKGEMKVIIELNFRGEFEMTRANEGYNRLVENLPEIYVGKVERLQNLIKILCCASKKCMKEKKMHMAPWRKYKYMQAKYLGSPEIKSETIFPVYNYRRLPRPSGSMLTFDLLDSLPPPPTATGLLCTAIKVI